MRKLLLAIGFFISLAASAQVTIQNTGSRIRYVNGLYVGTKLDTHFGAADSGAIYVKEDSTLMFKYKGTARALAYARGSDLTIGTTRLYDSSGSIFPSHYSPNSKSFIINPVSTNKDVNVYLTDSSQFNLIGGWGMGWKPSTLNSGPDFGTDIGGIAYRKPTETMTENFFLFRGGQYLFENAQAIWYMSITPTGTNIGSPAPASGTDTIPQSRLEVDGNLTIGNSYVRVSSAPANGLRVQGLSRLNGGLNTTYAQLAKQANPFTNVRYLADTLSMLIDSVGNFWTIPPKSGTMIYNFQTNAGSPILRHYRFNGTWDSKTAINSGESIGQFAGSGYDGTSTVSSSGLLNFVASEGWSSTAKGTRIAFSNTANTTTTLAEKMRLDQDGALLIGTTTNDGVSKLQVEGIAKVSSRLNVNGAADASTIALNVNGNASFGGNDVTAGNFIGTATNATAVTINDNNSTSADYYPIWTPNSGTYKNLFVSTARMYFNPSTGDLTTSGKSISNNVQSNYGVFSNGTTYINATTSIPSVSNGKLIVKSSSADYIAGFQANQTLGSSYGIMMQAGSNSSDISFLLRDYSNTNDYLKVRGDGQVSVYSLGTGTVYSNSGILTNTNPSDSTLKNTIKPLGYGLAEVLKLQPKTFYYNSDNTKSSLKYGFIAQEVKPIMPDIVREITVNKKIDGKNIEQKKLGLETDGIYVTLVKAIQEQQTIIDDLKKRIIALENK